MQQLKAGQFFGQTNETIFLDGLILTNTEYTYEKVDWHYHENAYFTFILAGSLIEGNKQEVFECSAGALLFHNWQDPHYNIKPKGFTRGFHIEIQPAWLNSFQLSLHNLQGNINVSNPDIKFLLYKILKETKINDNTTALSIQGLLLQTLSEMQRLHERSRKNKPMWVELITEILHDKYAEKLSLTDLSDTLGIHPVHLSRDFSKYFNCSLGDYVRKLKIEKALSLLPNKKKSLTDISLDCGFSDQSHFNRCFKEITNITPMAYRKILVR